MAIKDVALAVDVFANDPLGRECYLASGAALFSMMQDARLLSIRKTAAELAGVPGAWVEVGCLFAGTTAFFSTLEGAMGHERRECWVYDTFAGFPSEPSADDAADAKRSMTLFHDTNEQFVKAYLNKATRGRTNIVVGDFTETMKTRKPAAVAAALVDCDVGESAVFALGQLDPLMRDPRCVLLADDVGSGDFPGMQSKFIPYAKSLGWRQSARVGDLITFKRDR